MRATFVLGTFLLFATFALAAKPEPYLKAAPMPFYPALCRTARIQGEVTVRFTVDEHGDTANVEADGSNKLLKEAVIQNVKNWKYGWDSSCACRAKEKVIFKYILGDGSSDKGADLVVRWFGELPLTRVEIETGPILVNTSVDENKHVTR